MKGYDIVRRVVAVLLIILNVFIFGSCEEKDEDIVSIENLDMSGSWWFTESLTSYHALEEAWEVTFPKNLYIDNYSQQGLTLTISGIEQFLPEGEEWDENFSRTNDIPELIKYYSADIWFTNNSGDSICFSLNKKTENSELTVHCQVIPRESNIVVFDARKPIDDIKELSKTRIYN